MAKRFSTYKKYEKAFYQDLTLEQKAFWDYLCLACDHAGVWEVNFRNAKNALCISKDINASFLTAINKEQERVVPFDNGKKWFLKQFNLFQYGEFKKDKKLSVLQVNPFKQLLKYGIDPYTLEFIDKDKQPTSEDNTVVLFRDLEDNKDYDVDVLKQAYLADTKLVQLISKSQKRNQKTIPSLLTYFTDNVLKSTSVFKENKREYAKYFKNWLNKQPQEVATKQKTDLDFSLLSTKEQMTLEMDEQINLIKQRQNDNG